MFQLSDIDFAYEVADDATQPGDGAKHWLAAFDLVMRDMGWRKQPGGPCRCFAGRPSEGHRPECGYVKQS